MDRPARELLLARIASGTVRLTATVRGKPKRFIVVRPDRGDAYAAQEAHAEAFAAAAAGGLYADDDLLAHLLAAGLWDEDRQSLLEKLPGEIEQFKVALYEARFKSNERRAVRAALAAARAKLADLYDRRHAHDHLSCSGAAAAARARFLFAASVRTPDGRRVFPAGDAFWAFSGDGLEALMAAHAAARLSEAAVRELARTDPWRTTWGAHKAEGSLFGVPACDYTDEQLALSNWAGLYDGVYAHPECPPDDDVADDDVLDGWMLVQRRKRDRAQGRAADVGGEKTRDKQELYLVAETAEDARKVMALNSDVARATQRQRFAHLRERGTVHELEMPDTKRRLRQEAVQKFAAQAKGG